MKNRIKTLTLAALCSAVVLFAECAPRNYQIREKDYCEQGYCAEDEKKENEEKKPRAMDISGLGL